VFLLAQPAPSPERLVAAEREHFLRFVFESWAERPDAIDQEAFSQYLRALKDATIASMCCDFRASFWVDRADDEADRRTGQQIKCPVLVVIGDAEEQLADAGAVWGRWATDVTATTVPGHFPSRGSAQRAWSCARRLPRARVGPGTAADPGSMTA
jgi:haloacetate dehalogenase